MNKLISTHRTPFISQMIGWNVVAVMVLAFIIAIERMVLCICIVPMMFFIIQLSNSAVGNGGLVGWPSQHLEIYEDGLVLRTFLETTQWRWSHVCGIRCELRGDRYGLELENFRGELLKIEKLTHWRDAKSQIATRAGSVIYQQAMNTILRRDYVTVTPYLKISRYDLMIRDRKIKWEDIDSVQVWGGRMIIASPQINNLLRRVQFDVDRTRNGIVYAKLIQELWRDAVEITQPVEVVYIVVDGVAFNSEGEMMHNTRTNELKVNRWNDR